MARHLAAQVYGQCFYYTIPPKEADIIIKNAVV